MTRQDGADYYYQKANRASNIKDGLFSLNILLAVIALFLKEWNLQILQFGLTIAYIACEQIFESKYLFQAESIRRIHSWENAFGVSLTPITTQGYYNNRQTQGLKKYIVNQMESCFFTKNVLKADFWLPGLKTGLGLAVTLIALGLHHSQLALLVVNSFLFSYLGLELWQRCKYLKKVEKVYQNLENALIYQAEKEDATRQMATAFAQAQEYEAVKAYHQLPLNSKVFYKLNDTLTQQWNEIEKKIHFEDPAQIGENIGNSPK